MTSEKNATPEAALNLIVDAYESSLAKGLSPETVANAALTAALGLLVQVHGVDVVAKMMADIPEKVLKGDFTHEK